MSAPLIGLQVGPHSLLEHGIEPLLDRMQTELSANALFVYSHNYSKNPAHPPIWFRPDERRYGRFKHGLARPEHQWGGPDLLRALEKPCRDRGIRLIPRFLEWGFDRILDEQPAMFEAMSIDAHDRPHFLHFCVNHPDYEEWLVATAGDLAANYAIDGYQFGVEHDGALTESLMWQRPALCFCEHCKTRARAQGLDPERARQGYLKLERLMAAPPEARVESGFVALFRLLMDHPDMLGWHRFWYRSQERVIRRVFGAVKRFRPQAQTWWHLWHYPMSFEPFGRAATDCAELAGDVDVLKPVYYHDCGGDRFAGFIEKHACHFWLAEMEPEFARQFLFRTLGFTPEAEARDMDAMRRGGLSAEYVRSGVERCVRDAAGRALVVPGIGVDVPMSLGGAANSYKLDDPARLEACIHASADAGADGVLISREFEEMRPHMIAAAGRAIRAAFSV